MIDRKDIFMSGFKSKIGYSFTYKDLAEFEAIIDFYEQQYKKQKEVIDKTIETLEKGITFCKNDSQCSYDICNIAINREKEILQILGDKEVSE